MLASQKYKKILPFNTLTLTVEEKEKIINEYLADKVIEDFIELRCCFSPKEGVR